MLPSSTQTPMTSPMARKNPVTIQTTIARQSITPWLLLACLLWATVPVLAQTGTLMPSPYQTLLDTNGNPVVNGKVCTYLAGTTTPAATYTDVGLASPNANPIRTDTSGRFIAYLSPGASYKFVYQDATGTTGNCDGVTLKTVDNVSTVPGSSSGLDVTATAGESISAGQVVYLSDGSGGKSAGQWYKADSTNTYSNALPEIGIATAAILSGASGTARLFGQVSGLSSLTIGTTYYVGTAGALTSTAPNSARTMGVADTTTSLIVGGAVNPNVNAIDDFRLSLTTATCVTTADVTGATSIFLTPCTGNRLTLFDSTGRATTYTTSELTLAVPNSTGTVYDVFAFANSGVPTLEALAWTNSSTRATALVKTSGRYTKSGDSTRLYIGSFRTTNSVSGTTEDSAVKRYVWNYYHRVPRLLQRQESTATWTYTTATYRQANAAAANQVEAVVGVAEEMIDLQLIGAATNGSATVAAIIAIGEDSTTAASGFPGSMIVQVATQVVWTTAFLKKYPAAGYHFYAWLEFSAASGTTTWSGTGFAVAGQNQSGLTGWING